MANCNPTADDDFLDQASDHLDQVSDYLDQGSDHLVKASDYLGTFFQKVSSTVDSTVAKISNSLNPKTLTSSSTSIFTSVTWTCIFLPYLLFFIVN
jgi:Mg2+ and Co2+ transporter CorA